MKRIRVEFIPDKSNPPPVHVNNPEAREENAQVREEIRGILNIIKIGQSFKIYGMPYAKASSMVHGLAKGSGLLFTMRNFEDSEECYVQAWRSS